ncbi:hypothetical protein ACIG0D_27285 [Streptomyces sp. NPDC052773]|uniref:hypothetical protein n=1 Tax=Streptomyces sp. NPDC052773 TaxID=3365693 RepID=UPI0037D3267F
MNTRTAACAALIALAALTTGCSAGGADDKPEQPVATVTATKTVDPVAAREACVDAWAEAILANDDLGLEDEPVECDGLPEDDRLDRYMEGLQRRNEISRGAFDQGVG